VRLRGKEGHTALIHGNYKDRIDSKGEKKVPDKVTEMKPVMETTLALLEG